MELPLIQLSDIYKAFGDNKVLTGADLSILEGQVTTIIGKSGVGKSVLLKHIIGLMEPDSGKILFRGRLLSEMRKSEKTAFKKKFSYVFQGTALFDSITVFENIALPLKEKTPLKKAEINNLVRKKMDQLDLQGVDEKYPSQLSGGMKKRVALARALVTDPEIVLFDEPTTGLDPVRKNAVHKMISDYQKQFGFTGVVVSHEIPDIFYISQRVAMLEGGRIVFEGSPEKIQQTWDPMVQNFIHGLERGHKQISGIESHFQGERRIKEEMARLQRYHTPFSIIIFKVENLEEINEKLGPTAGLTIITNLANELQTITRFTDTCYRFGLDKILLLLPNIDREQTQGLCEKLAGRILGKDIFGLTPHSGLCLFISASFKEGQKGGSYEQMLLQTQSMQNMFYEFKVC
ncbi:MAG: ATP-binding cassette domain-containing protein [Desulfobacterales bacterium]|jgi:phospholipid/cholesterol/gamma-HCH transport system ATP-binding protein|nr:ATP-binding cassette domain-containing protein [Desulfobacterales bacterium]